MSKVAMQRTRSTLFSLFLTLAAATAGAQQLTFSTENDIFGTRPSRDDLHTFAVKIEIEGGGSRFALREEAFTDRAGGIRFDETTLSVGRPLPLPGSWSAYGEAGAVRLGRGLFGEDVQNDLHRALGSDEVALPYLEPSLHARLALAGERTLRGGALGGRLDFGPRVELEWVSGVRAHALVAARAELRLHPAVAVHALVGARWSDADLDVLDRHTRALGAVARLGVTLYDRIVVDWSTNDHGDGRTHLAVGYRFASFRVGEEPPVRR